MENNGKQEYINTDQGDRIKWLEEHYTNFNTEMGTVQADVKWLKWFMKLMIASQVAVIIGLIKIIFVG